jgi:plasmid stability protein
VTLAGRSLPATQQPSILAGLKATFELDADLYRAVRVEAARADRSVREVVEEALASWLAQAEETEDRESAAHALAEYERDGGASAAAWFGKLAAETKAAYDTESG